MNDSNDAMVAPRRAGGAALTPARTQYAAVPPFDAGKYWSYLETVEATDAEKTALLQTLWALMARFVELGFGVDPVQTLVPALVASALAEDEASGAGRPLSLDAEFQHVNAAKGALEHDQ